MSFVLRSFINCLPSQAALKHEKSSSLCLHCNNHKTLHHILNFCSVFLNQGRYTWRHNSVLNHLVLALGSAYSASDTPQIFADLPGHLSSSDSTIPSHVLPTSIRPDLVLLFPPNRKIYILELTVPFETNISSARLRKSNHYASLLTDLRLSAYQAKFFSLEVGSRGFLSPSNFETLLSLTL